VPERGGSLRCQRTHLIAPLTNTAVLSEQDGVGLHRGSKSGKKTATISKECQRCWALARSRRYCWQPLSP